MKACAVTPKLLDSLIWEAMSRLGRQPTVIRMNVDDYTDLRSSGREVLDQVTDRATLKSGLHATLWACQIRVNKEVQAGRVSFEDDKGGRWQACLFCRGLFKNSECESNLCVVRYVIDA